MAGEFYDLEGLTKAWVLQSHPHGRCAWAYFQAERLYVGPDLVGTMCKTERGPVALIREAHGDTGNALALLLKAEEAAQALAVRSFTVWQADPRRHERNLQRWAFSFHQAVGFIENATKPDDWRKAARWILDEAEAYSQTFGVPGLDYTGPPPEGMLSAHERQLKEMH